jgi:hypothetical protein
MPAWKITRNEKNVQAEKYKSLLLKRIPLFRAYFR